MIMDENKTITEPEQTDGTPMYLTEEEIEEIAGEKPMPVWVLNAKKINEPMFSAEFLENHALRCINGHFIGYDGVVDDRIIEKEIYTLI